MATIVNATNKDKLCLLINKTEKTIFCLCESAFYTADLITFSVKKLKKDIGSLVICNDNAICEIIDVEKKDLMGKTLFEKLKNFMLGEYKISIQFRSRDDISLGEIKSILKNIIESNEFAYDYFFVDEDEETAKKIILDKLNDAKSIKEIIDIFNCTKDKCLETF